MSEEQVEIVDEQNKVIDVVPRSQMRRDKLPHRASYIALCDRQGRFLVEVRSLQKDYAPGLLDACVGGVVTAGEDPLLSAKRELKEEVGIDADKADFYPLGELKIPSDPLFVYGYLFFCRSDAITVRQESEVSGILLLDEEELKKLDGNYAPDSRKAFDEILSRARKQDLL